LIEIINKQLLLQLVGYLCYWQMGFNSVFKGLIIWHTVLSSFPCLLNQMHSSPVLCSSSLHDFLPNFAISDFLSATHNILIADCNSDSQSAVVMSTTF